MLCAAEAPLTDSSARCGEPIPLRYRFKRYHRCPDSWRDPVGVPVTPGVPECLSDDGTGRNACVTFGAELRSATSQPAGSETDIPVCPPSAWLSDDGTGRNACVTFGAKQSAPCRINSAARRVSGSARWRALTPPGSSRPAPGYRNEQMYSQRPLATGDDQKGRSEGVELCTLQFFDVWLEPGRRGTTGAHESAQSEWAAHIELACQPRV